MSKKTLNIVGMADYQPFNFDKYPKRRERIIEAITGHCVKKGIALPNMDEFLADISHEIAITITKTELLNKQLDPHDPLKEREPHPEETPKKTFLPPTRKNICRDVMNIRDVTTANQLVEKTPPQVRGILYGPEIAIHRAKTPHDVAKAKRLLMARVERDLTGKGRDHDQRPVPLAFGIAQALRSIGISPVASRPTHDSKTVYHVVVEECFRIAGLAWKDPYPQMDAALQARIQDEP